MLLGLTFEKQQLRPTLKVRTEQRSAGEKWWRPATAANNLQEAFSRHKEMGKQCVCRGGQKILRSAALRVRDVKSDWLIYHEGNGATKYNFLPWPQTIIHNDVAS